eukprot:TRINITY_DN4303_c0_g1_i2.p1 TRINITY_DN4303_c0_g1~~TRINITY_DN4303_c0_g1_i2.p1  ORF type:complete len:216 (-),score=34.04 TRINITY_DN4303_c0_g1_i2:184-831(-)
MFARQGVSYAVSLQRSSCLFSSLCSRAAASINYNPAYTNTNTNNENNMANCGDVVVLAGPSGSGKSTLVKKLLAEFPDDFGFSVSHTSRDARPGEADGTDYHFKPREEIEAQVNDNKFIESAVYGGNYYGTSIAAVEDVLGQDKRCILDIDSQGVKSVKASNLNDKAVYIFIRPPSMEALEVRLLGRGDTSRENIDKRLKIAAGEVGDSQEEGGF